MTGHENLTERIRLTVYRQFATDGRPPTVAAMAQEHQVDATDVVTALRQLAEQRHLVLGEDPTGLPTVLMAHPFSAVPLGFSVMGPRTLWWGGCAWDSFALPHLLPDIGSALVATECPACLRPHAFRVTADDPPPGDQVAHFLVPAAHMWDDVLHTCSNQRIYCSPTCVEDWLNRTWQQPGYTMSLTTLWHLAAHWYDGRLDAGYTRRDPAQAQRYFDSVGLSGPFWAD